MIQVGNQRMHFVVTMQWKARGRPIIDKSDELEETYRFDGVRV